MGKEERDATQGDDDDDGGMTVESESMYETQYIGSGRGRGT